MTIIKQDRVLETAQFVFDNGDVIDILLTVNMELYDDVANEQVTRHRSTESVWASLTSAQRTQANTVGQKLKAMAETF